MNPNEHIGNTTSRDNEGALEFGTTGLVTLKVLIDICISSLLKLETTQLGISSDLNFHSDTEADFVNSV